MKIELYLRTIMQEYPDERQYNSKTLVNNDRECWSNWTFDWGAQKWRNGELLKETESEMTEQTSQSKLKNLEVRKEIFGALLYDRLSTAVYKVNSEGLSAIELLRCGLSPREVSGRLDVSSELMDSFIKNLKDFHLW